MTKTNNENRKSIGGQSICFPSNQSCSFIYQLPDVVLQRKHDRKMPYAETFNGIILFADVSGFTEMCQKYSIDVQRGVNQLANALNGYMAPIVEAILREKGDVYKFAGDAVLGLWPFANDSIEHKREQAKRVITCALYMKKSFCDYMTPIGTVLNIKSAIAMGSYSLIFLRGNTSACSKILDEYGPKAQLTTRHANFYSETMKKNNAGKHQSINYVNKTGLTEEMIEHCRSNLVNYYVCYGSAVVSARNAEHECKSQDIIVDMATWLLLDSDSEYMHEKFAIEHDDEDVEIPSRSSSHQTEMIGQGPSNTITTAISKHLTPPNKNREILPIQKILCHYIRLHGRRNDIAKDINLSDSYSSMSTDSIELNDDTDALKYSKILNQDSSRDNFLNVWNTPKTTSIDINDTDIKDFSFFSTATKTKQGNFDKRVTLTEEQSMKLRPSAYSYSEEYDTSALSTFIIKPVRNQESLDQLSELRLINICFINIILTDYKIKYLPYKLQTVIDCCAEQISITNGLLTKIFMFDKGLSLLCAFGMPGYKHPDDAERALKFAFLITQRLEKLNFVARVSTGVSTGQTFCGVLGHPLRCEYTVIGRKVNMAARLMVNYPGIVACDDETYHKAHLEERYFEFLPTVPLKGLTVSTSMRRYKGQDDDEHNMTVFVFPIINREDEWNLIFEYIEEVIKHSCTTIHCVFLTGLTGVGRSRLLAHVNEELIYDTRNIRRVSYNASFEHVQLFGYALKQLFKKLLYTELQESDALLQLLKSLLPNHEKYLYLLRPFFDKLSVDTDKLTGVLKRTVLEEIIRELICNATNPAYEITNYQPQPTIFIIDDAQYIDKESWQYLNLLGSAPTSLLVMAMRDPTLNDDELHTRMDTLRDLPTTKHIPLMGLDNRYLSTLACQAMFVQRIPKDLEILITRKSDKGHPQHIIQLLSDLLSNQIIRIETINNDDDLNDGYIEGIQKYLWKRVVKHDPATGNIKILFEYVEPQLCRICDLDRNKFWAHTTVIENINAHVKIDKLRDFEKRIAKISSLFTKNISKRIIVHAITNYDIHTNELLTVHQHHLNNNKHHTIGFNADLLKINSAFSQLYRAQIFECAWLDFEARKNSTIARLLQEKNLTPICCCPENMTKQIENCHMFTFKDPTLKEATLATIIDQFQHDYSSKMAVFLESNSHLCKSCGGDSNSLIFLTPVQSMKLGMSILDTFHERKLNQLNRRLQYIIFNHFSMQQTYLTNDNEDKKIDDDDDDDDDDDRLPLIQIKHDSFFNNDKRKEKNLMQNFHQNLYHQELNEKRKYFHELRTNIKQIEALTQNTKPLSSFSPMAIGGRKDTIEGETYARIPIHLQENSLTHAVSPIIASYQTRPSIESTKNVLMNDKKNSLTKDLEKISLNNNHYYETSLDDKRQFKTCNEFLKIYLSQHSKNRLIINQLRFSKRHLFKFRRKKCLNRIKAFNHLCHDNHNNNYMSMNELPKITIEQMLSHRWIQTFENKKTERTISLLEHNIEKTICCSFTKRDEKYPYAVDSVCLIPPPTKQLNNRIQRTCKTRIANHSSTIFGMNQAIIPSKSQLELNRFHTVHNGNKNTLYDYNNHHFFNRNKYIQISNSSSFYNLSQMYFSPSEAEHRIKHLDLSREADDDSTSTVFISSMMFHNNNNNNNNNNNSNEKPLKKDFIIEENLFINERLHLNFIETCPLFLLKDGIDHRFEFLDFAPDLHIRQRFRPINHDAFILNNIEIQSEQINSTNSITTKLFSNKILDEINPTTEIEYNLRNCRCNYLLVEIYRLLIKLWDQSSNLEKVLYYSLELARVELTRTNYYESKIILQNILGRLQKGRNHLNLPSFFEPQIYELLSESVYRMRKNDEAFLYIVRGLNILNVQLTDFRSRDSSKLKSQCKQLRHTLLRTLIRPTINKKLSDDEIIQRYFTGKLLFRAGQCARRHGQLLFAYFCVLNAALSLIQCHSILTSYEHCQSLILLTELSHDLKRMEDCDLFIQAIIKYVEPVNIGYETIAIKSNWLSMTWNLYRGKIDRALNDSYKIKDLLTKIGAYENLMSVATYSLQAALIGRREEVIRDLIDLIDNESNRPLKYENRLWAFILALEAFTELNIEYDEKLLNEIAFAIDYVLEHLEKKTSTPGDIHKFLTMVFYAQATLVQSYTKIVKLDSANEHYMRAIKFGVSLKEWTFRVYNGMLKLAIYEIYECTKWLMETRISILPKPIHDRLIITHMHDISKHFKLLRPRYLMCYALKLLITGNQRSAKTQFSNAIHLANDLELESERKHIEMTRTQIFKIITKRKTKRKRKKN
ncbi:unnamed protein product [Rotaria socialis]|uniref:Guanylate cyclase domain-containing protein n=1 Tax=Rotaria socialis TaxID=392032 RepID=A0A818VBK5_9BILA|nr:unnamed protein product [Rotaria socialis]